MSEQIEQKSEQTTNETKSVSEMTSEEIAAEIKRVDQELAQEPSSVAHQDVSNLGNSRRPFTDARSGEEIVKEIGATRRDLIRQYESLEQDSRYSDEHKAQKSWEAFDRAKTKIEARAGAARETLLKDAERLEEASLPFPGGQAVRTDKVELLSLTQGERQRISERLSYQHPAVQRLKAQGKNAPDFEDSTLDKLREEYKRGLKEGGPRGGAVCRATLQLASDRGIDTNSIVDEFRSDWQRASLQNAQQQRIQAHAVYSKVPLPSTRRPGGAKSIGEAAAGKGRTALGLKKKASGATTAKARRKKPPWK